MVDDIPGAPPASDGRPAGVPTGDRPGGDRPRSDRPRGGRNRGNRPAGSAPQAAQPQGAQPRGERPPGDRPQGERPQGDRPRSDSRDGRRDGGRGKGGGKGGKFGKGPAAAPRREIYETLRELMRGPDFRIDKFLVAEKGTGRPVKTEYRLTREGLKEVQNFARLSDAQAAAIAPLPEPEPEPVIEPQADAKTAVHGEESTASEDVTASSEESVPPGPETASDSPPREESGESGEHAGEHPGEHPVTEPDPA